MLYQQIHVNRKTPQTPTKRAKAAQICIFGQTSLHMRTTVDRTDILVFRSRDPVHQITAAGGKVSEIDRLWIDVGSWR
jgi:hypothetical protein